MQPQIVTRPAFTVVGVKYRGKNENNEISQLWEKLGRRMPEVRHVVSPPVYYGVVGNYDEKTGEFDYTAACEVERAARVPDGMISWHVPSQTYAVFPCTLVTLGAIYETIHQVWLPTSGYQCGAGPEFELYDARFDPNNDSSQMYIYIPVRRQ